MKSQIGRKGRNENRMKIVGQQQAEIEKLNGREKSASYQMILKKKFGNVGFEKQVSTMEEENKVLYRKETDKHSKDPSWIFNKVGSMGRWKETNYLECHR